VDEVLRHVGIAVAQSVETRDRSIDPLHRDQSHLASP
jgi:hypothetical protein